MFIFFKLGYDYSSCCYSVFSTDFLILSLWRVSYIIQLPSYDLGPPFVGRPGYYLSACPIRHLPKPFVSCGSQGSTVQGSSPHKCSQEIWWDALNVMAATIPSVMLRLTPSSKLFLYSMTSSNNMPPTWPYCSKV